MTYTKRINNFALSKKRRKAILVIVGCGALMIVSLLVILKAFGLNFDLRSNASSNIYIRTRCYIWGKQPYNCNAGYKCVSVEKPNTQPNVGEWGKCVKKVVAKLTPTPLVTPSVSPPLEPTVVRKVMIIDFNPIIEFKGGRRLRDIVGWQNPINLEAEYIKAIKESSHGYLTYDIVERISNIDKYPTKENGYVFTDEDYFDMLGGHSIYNYESLMSYNKVLNDYQVCEKRNRGEIDEVWLWGGPGFGFYEAVMTGPRSHYTNGSPILNTTCTKPLHIMGFSYERHISEMLEDFGHRVEGTMNTIYGGWFNGEETLWDKFTKSRAFHSQEGSFPNGCGTVHEPFNASRGYDWGNTDMVATDCENWNEFPNLTYKTKTENCTVFGCRGDTYLQWWMSHFPHVSGVTNGIWNNWWKYFIPD